jgi:hypothetical protein
MQSTRRISQLAGVVVSLTLAVAQAAGAATGTPAVAPQPLSDSQIQPQFTLEGGASVLRTTRTVPHWFGSSLDPTNGVTYGYNMVGADPSNCSGTACSVTVSVDITPINLNIDGVTFSGSDVTQPLLDSPLFALNDYGSTPYATAGDPGAPSRGPGGVLSQGDAGNPLQLQDAIMRAEFNQVGRSPYHLRLQPSVLPAVSINVPQGQATLRVGSRGVLFAEVTSPWWSGVIDRLRASADPAHLALYVSDDTVLGDPKKGCCVFGFHAAAASAGSNGNASVQTYAWSSWLSPGLVAQPNGGPSWVFQDMDAFSHEIAEWSNDPFGDNTVQTWQIFPGFPQYGCSSLLETGDAAALFGFAVGHNTFRQGPNPNGTQSADGYYHPQDEMTLPWFMQSAPNTTSEPTQTASPNGGRYSLLGDLNTYAPMREPSTGC